VQFTDIIYIHTPTDLIKQAHRLEYALPSNGQTELDQDLMAGRRGGWVVWVQVGVWLRRGVGGRIYIYTHTHTHVDMSNSTRPGFNDIYI